MANTEMVWTGDVPKHCDLCSAPLKEQFTDGRTVYGSWATLCFLCAMTHGSGYGVGNGQKYKKKGKRWIKVEG